MLVGHSMGADVALRIAAALPARIAGLALVDHNLRPVEAASRLVAAEFREADRTFRSVEDYAAWLAARRPVADRMLIAEVAPRALRAMSGGGFALKRDPALLAARTADGPNRDSLRMLAQLNVPVLVVRGRMSSFLSADAARIAAETARDGTVVIVARAGHTVMLDDPEGLAQVLTAFAERAFAAEETVRVAALPYGN